MLKYIVKLEEENRTMYKLYPNYAQAINAAFEVWERGGNADIMRRDEIYSYGMTELNVPS